jgi:hypothetical protein
MSSIDKSSVDELEFQLKELQKDYDYNLKGYPIEVMLQKFKLEDYVDSQDSVSSIFIPKYQRAYVWKHDMKCKFIESLFLGVPIPPLFAFTLDESGNMELIDGVQRLSTIREFVTGSLKISGVDLLDKLNNFTFKDLHPSRQRKFNSLDIRVYVLSENADEGVRGDIFNRINSTGEKLTDAEVRKGAFLDNAFYDFILDCIEIQEFNKLFTTTKTRGTKLRGEKEELVTRFFAYSEEYQTFEHSVKHFLNEYIIKKGKEGFDRNEKKNEFERMLDFVLTYFPNGFRKTTGSKSIPRVRFEAISVGSNLALRQNSSLIPKDMKWLESEEFKNHTTSDASNNKNKLKNRIEFVRDCLLGNKDSGKLTYSEN